jgi:hypothetical protein
VGEFIITLLREARLEELVGKDACLWKAVHSLLDFHEHISALGLGVEVVFIAEFLGEEVEVHFHVLKSIEGGFQIETLDVGAHVLGVWRADDAVPKELGGRKVGRTGGQFARVVDEVAADCDADAVWVVLLRAVIDNDSGVGNRAVGWDLQDFFGS